MTKQELISRLEKLKVLLPKEQVNNKKVALEQEISDLETRLSDDSNYVRKSLINDRKEQRKREEAARSSKEKLDAATEDLLRAELAVKEADARYNDYNDNVYRAAIDALEEDANTLFSDVMSRVSTMYGETLVDTIKENPNLTEAERTNFLYRYNVIEAEQERLELELDSLKSEYEAATVSLEVAKQNESKLRAEHEIIQARLDEFNARRAEVPSDVSIYAKMKDERTLEELKSTLASMEEYTKAGLEDVIDNAISGLSSDTLSIEDAIESLRIYREKFVNDQVVEHDMNLRYNEITSIRAMRTSLEKDISDLEARLADESNYAYDEEEVAASKERLMDVTARRDILPLEITRSQNRITSLTNNNIRLQEERDLASSTISTYRRQVERSEEELTSLQSTLPQNAEEIISKLESLPITLTPEERAAQEKEIIGNLTPDQSYSLGRTLELRDLIRSKNSSITSQEELIRSVDQQIQNNTEMQQLEQSNIDAYRDRYNRYTDIVRNFRERDAVAINEQQRRLDMNRLAQLRDELAAYDNSLAFLERDFDEELDSIIRSAGSVIDEGELAETADELGDAEIPAQTEELGNGEFAETTNDFDIQEEPAKVLSFGTNRPFNNPVTSETELTSTNGLEQQEPTGFVFDDFESNNQDTNEEPVKEDNFDNLEVVLPDFSQQNSGESSNESELETNSELDRGFDSLKTLNPVQLDELDNEVAAAINDPANISKTESDLISEIANKNGYGPSQGYRVPYFYELSKTLLAMQNGISQTPNEPNESLNNDEANLETGVGAPLPADDGFDFGDETTVPEQQVPEAEEVPGQDQSQEPIVPETNESLNNDAVNFTAGVGASAINDDGFDFGNETTVPEPRVPETEEVPGQDQSQEPIVPETNEQSTGSFTNDDGFDFGNEGNNQEQAKEAGEETPKQEQQSQEQGFEGGQEQTTQDNSQETKSESNETESFGGEQINTNNNGETVDGTYALTKSEIIQDFPKRKVVDIEEAPEELKQQSKGILSKFKDWLKKVGKNIKEHWAKYLCGAALVTFIVAGINNLTGRNVNDADLEAKVATEQEAHTESQSGVEAGFEEEQSESQEFQTETQATETETQDASQDLNGGQGSQEGESDLDQDLDASLESANLIYDQQQNGSVTTEWSEPSNEGEYVVPSSGSPEILSQEVTILSQNETDISQFINQATSGVTNEDPNPDTSLQPGVVVSGGEYVGTSETDMSQGEQGQTGSGEQGQTGSGEQGQTGDEQPMSTTEEELTEEQVIELVNQGVLDPSALDAFKNKEGNGNTNPSPTPAPTTEQTGDETKTGEQGQTGSSEQGDSSQTGSGEQEESQIGSNEQGEQGQTGEEQPTSTTEEELTEDQVRELVNQGVLPASALDMYKTGGEQEEANNIDGLINQLGNNPTEVVSQTK